MSNKPTAPDTKAALPPSESLAGLSLGALTELVTRLGQPRFRAGQVFEAVHRHGALHPNEITTLPLAFRETLSREVLPPATALTQVQESKDGTTKFLFTLADGQRVEAVLIPEGKRNTVCISSQVGCPIRCVFCASGVKGLIRNLTVSEIVEPLLHVQRHLKTRPTNIVMMGMGEPLLNLENLACAIALWTHEKGLNFSPRRITVSAASTPVRIDRLADRDLGVHIAVSLHAPDDDTRAALVPGSPSGRVKGLIDAAARYARRTGRDATVEYVLIAGINDAPHHARDLARRIRGRHIHVNLIPFNPVSHRPDLEAPSRQVCDAFARDLREDGVSVTLRTQRGEDIDAACGQLAFQADDR